MAVMKMQQMLTNVRQKLMIPIIASSEGYLSIVVYVSFAEVGAV
jgi:hypothetical protein